MDIVKFNLDFVLFDGECVYVIISPLYGLNISDCIFCFHFKLMEKILTAKPGGESIMQEYAKTKSLRDATRRQMINILAAEMTQTLG